MNSMLSLTVTSRLIADMDDRGTVAPTVVASGDLVCLWHAGLLQVFREPRPRVLPCFGGALAKASDVTPMV